jgi:hypothetical protein
MRLIEGLSLFSISSTVLELMPYSSASSMAYCDQRTMSANWLSPWRTAGARGSLEMISGSTMKSSAVAGGGTFAARVA